MKKWILIPSVVVMLNTYGSQKSCKLIGHVQSTRKFTVAVFQPVFDFFNSWDFDTARIKSSTMVNNSFDKEIHLQYPSFIVVSIYDEKNKFITSIDLLLTQGDTVRFCCNLDSTEVGVTFSGVNAQGNQLLFEKDYVLSKKYTPLFSILDNVKGSLISLPNQLDSLAIAQTSDFTKLYEKKLISLSYLNAIKDYYTYSYYSRVLTLLFNKYNKSATFNTAEKFALANVLFSRKPPGSLNYLGLRNGPMYLAISEEISALKTLNKQWVEDISKRKFFKLASGNKIEIDESFSLSWISKNKKLQDYFYATALMSCFKYAPGECGDNELKCFKTLFPLSKWVNIAKSQYDYQKKIERIVVYTRQMPLRFVDSTLQFKSIETLIKTFPKNKPVFIDIWASWCKPCIAEFAENEDIDLFFIKNDIDRLYISVDNSKQKWLQSIEKYQLGGTHYFADSSFLPSIKRALGVDSNSGFAIPRFLIGYNGNIIDYDTPPPSSLTFKEYIKKKIKEECN